MKKRALSVLLAVAMLLTVVLSGCGNPAPAASSAAPAPAAPAASGSEAAPAPADNPFKDEVKLKWYTVAATPPDDALKVQTELNKYLKEKINATVDITFMSYADYNQKMPTVISSGEQYDICFTSGGDNPYVANVANGAFVDLTPYMQTVGKEMYAAVDPAFWKGISIDGKIYGVPTNKELPWAPVWTFSSELLEKYNITLPENTNDIKALEPFFEAVHKGEPSLPTIGVNKNGLRTVFDDQYDTHINALVPLVTKLEGDDPYTVLNMCSEENLLEFALQMQDYYKKGYIQQDAPTLAGVPVLKFANPGDYQPFAENIWARTFGYPVTCVSRYDNIITTSSTIGALQAVSITSPNPERATAFLNLLNTDPYVKNLLTYGIEGVHYEKTGENSIKFLEGNKAYLIPGYTMGNMFIGYTVDPDPTEKWTAFQKFNAEATRAPLLGFNFNADKVKSEVAAIKVISQEYQPQIFTGAAKDMKATIAEYNKKLEAAGLAKIQTEMQTQIDAFVAANK